MDPPQAPLNENLHPSNGAFSCMNVLLIFLTSRKGEVGEIFQFIKKKKNLKKFNSSVGFMSNGRSDCEKCGHLTEGWKHWEWWKEVATL